MNDQTQIYQDLDKNSVTWVVALGTLKMFDILNFKYKFKGCGVSDGRNI